MAVVYQIRNTVNNKVYIGSTVNVNRRRKIHFYHLRKGIHSNKNLQKDWVEYGDKCFAFEILEDFGKVKVTREKLIACEQKYLDEVFGINCYNIAPNANHYGYEQGRICATNGHLERIRKLVPPEHLEKARACIKDKTKGSRTRAANTKNPCVMVSPEGDKYLVINRSSFAKHFKLYPDALTKMLSDDPKWSRYKSCKGWRGYRVTPEEASKWIGRVWNLDRVEIW